MQINIPDIIEQGENQYVEFKTSFNKGVIESLVVFSNTKGGQVIIGVTDNKEIVGIKFTKESIQNWINEIKQSTIPQIIPDVDIYSKDNKKIVCFNIQEFPVKPVAYKDRFFIRKQNANHKLNTDEIVELRFLSLNYSFDAFAVNATFEALDKKALSIFKKRIEKSGRYPFSDSLEVDFKKLGFIQKNKLSRAAELLFGTHHTSIHLGRFKSQTEIIDDIVIRSPLIIAVEEALAFIKRNIAFGFEFGGDNLSRKEYWQYPIPVLRELLLNAIVHKDYSNPTDIIIKIFDHSIEIVNPGKLMGGLTIDMLKTDNYQARHRNKLLAEAFYLIGDIEKYGTGFRRIKKWLENHEQINLEIENLVDLIKLTISSTINDTNFTKDFTKEEREEREENILMMIKNNTQITTTEIASKLRLTRRTIQSDIESLKEQNKIKRTGGRKTGHWEIIKQ